LAESEIIVTFAPDIIKIQAMTVREMKNDVVRRLTKLDNNDAKTMQSIWLFITKTLPEEDPEEAAETQDNEDAIRQRGKEAFLTIRRMAEAGELPELTMDEINEEIRLYREGK